MPRRDRQRRARAASLMPFAAGLYWEEQGPADGEPLILSAGLGGSAGYWAPNLAALAGRHRVIAYDHRGTGRSDRALAGEISVESMAGDILAVLDAAGIARAHLVGHAAGGVMGLALALAAPDRLGKLVVVNGWAQPDPHFARCFDMRLALLHAGGPRAYLQAQPIFLYPARWISEHSARLDTEAEASLAHFPAAETIERRIAALRAFDIAARLGEIDAPVLLVASADDMLVPASCSDRLAVGIPCATLAAMTGGHACNVTEPEAFDRLVLGWLAGNCAQGS